MRKELGIICAELVSVGKPEKRRGSSYRKLTFRNIDSTDKNEYMLYVVDGYSQSKRFMRFPIGAKLKNIKVYSDKDKMYVDVHSDAQEIKAQPLF